MTKSPREERGLAIATFLAAVLAVIASTFSVYVTVATATSQAVREDRGRVYADYLEHLNELDSLLRNRQQFDGLSLAARSEHASKLTSEAGTLLVDLDIDEARIEMLGSAPLIDLLGDLKSHRQLMYNRYVCGAGGYSPSYCQMRAPGTAVGTADVGENLEQDREELKRVRGEFIDQARIDIGTRCATWDLMCRWLS